MDPQWFLIEEGMMELGKVREMLTTNTGPMDVSECNTVWKKCLKAWTIILT